MRARYSAKEELSLSNILQQKRIIKKEGKIQGTVSLYCKGTLRIYFFFFLKYDMNLTREQNDDFDKYNVLKLKLK